MDAKWFEDDGKVVDKENDNMENTVSLEINENTDENKENISKTIHHTSSMYVLYKIFS